VPKTVLVKYDGDFIDTSYGHYIHDLNHGNDQYGILQSLELRDVDTAHSYKNFLQGISNFTDISKIYTTLKVILFYYLHEEDLLTLRNSQKKSKAIQILSFDDQQFSQEQMSALFVRKIG